MSEIIVLDTHIWLWIATLTNFPPIGLKNLSILRNSLFLPYHAKWVCKINYTVAIGSRESGVVNRQKIRQF
jgi:PIN domain nuclease of toxin-antitoxin system